MQINKIDHIHLISSIRFNWCIFCESVHWIFRIFINIEYLFFLDQIFYRITSSFQFVLYLDHKIKSIWIIRYVFYPIICLCDFLNFLINSKSILCNDDNKLLNISCKNVNKLILWNYCFWNMVVMWSMWSIHSVFVIFCLKLEKRLENCIFLKEVT